MNPHTSTFDRGEILVPPPDGLEVLHDREYRVRAFRKGANLLIRGAVRDQKPPGLYLVDDPDPLTFHHMQVDLEVAFPSLEIIAVNVVFEMHPNEVCPTIAEHYQNLVGLSIARGFTHRVRELFGGPRGCTHTTALLQAMAPVAVQCFWSMTAGNERVRGGHDTTAATALDPRATSIAMNRNTCHVWADDSEFVDALRSGAPMQAPLSIRRRAEERGIDPGEFMRHMRGS